jgi:hypothetical protein
MNVEKARTQSNMEPLEQEILGPHLPRKSLLWCPFNFLG